MSYIDGFVMAVPSANRETFVNHASATDALFLEHGALRVRECWGDDVPDGKVTDFKRAVQATADEIVVLALVEWPDKATRDAGMAKYMTDPRLAQMPEMPFDGGRMIFGGFVPVVELGK